MSNSGQVEPQAPVSEMDTPTAEQPDASAPEVKENKKQKPPKEKKAKAPAHPPYFQMIKEAVTALNEKGGSSPYAIAKYMEEKHKAVLPGNFRKTLGLQLKNSVAKGKLIKIKASYKLSEAGKRGKTSGATTTTTKAVRANAGKPIENNTTKRKQKSKELSKIENTNSTAPPPSAPAAITRGRRSKRSGPVKTKPQLKSIKSKAKRASA